MLTELRLQRVSTLDLKKAGKPGSDLALLLQLFDEQLEERGLADLADVLALATLPARQDIAEAAWRGAKLEAVASTLKLAADVRRQYSALRATWPLVVIGILSMHRLHS